MISAEDWALVRRLVADGVPRRQVARDLGIRRSTVARALACDRPPKYERAAVPTAFTPFEPLVAQLLDLWFPPYRIPLEDGTTSLLPVLVITCTKAEAIYERATRTVRCVGHGVSPYLDVPVGEEQDVSVPEVVDPGTAGAAARREFERPKAAREVRIPAKPRSTDGPGSSVADGILGWVRG